MNEHEIREIAALAQTGQAAPRMGEAEHAPLEIAREALREIAWAGMSGTGQESEEGMRDWHARRAWEFIGIAARALDAMKAAPPAPALSEPDPLQGAATWLKTAVLKCDVSDLMDRLLIGYNRAGRLFDAAPNQTPAPAPAAQGLSDAPDMFWDDSDPERGANDIDEIVADYGLGEEVTIQCAKRQPNLRVRVILDPDIEDWLTYEVIEANSAAQPTGGAK